MQRKKINTIKFVRELTGFGLLECKNIVEALKPSFVIRKDLGSTFSPNEFVMYEITIPAFSTVQYAIDRISTYIIFEYN